MRRSAPELEPIQYRNVMTLGGVPYVLPRYPDKRGTSVSIKVKLKNIGSVSEDVVLITGYKVVFDLVLHRTAVLSGVTTLRTYAQWTISEPLTGCRVVSGSTRQHAMDALAELVAFYGGEAVFNDRLSTAVENERKERSAN